VANAVGRLKGKAAIRIHREYLGRTRNFTGLHFWDRGYCVSTVDFKEAASCKFFGDYVHLRDGLLGEPQLFSLLVEFHHF
jgi:Transposase IS200 like